MTAKYKAKVPEPIAPAKTAPHPLLNQQVLNPSAHEWHKAPEPEGSQIDKSFERFMATQDNQNHALQELVRQQQQSTMALTLPQPTVPLFSGDPLHYCDFVRAFEQLIEQKTASSSARLYYLGQYTSAQAQELMKSCLSMREDQGYKEARRLLKERYGQDYRVASAHVQRLTDGSPIKSEDGAALQQFSIQLIQVV